MPRKMAPSPRWTQAAAWSLVMWNFQVNAQDGPLHIPCDEVKPALMQDRQVVLQAKDERPLGTSGNGRPIGGGEQAALWRCWTRNQGH